MSDNVGRRPEGPGEYRYTLERMCVDNICLVQCRWSDKSMSAFWIGEADLICQAPVAAMPGDFLPLTKPVAAPQPVITPEILDTIEDAILIADDDSIGAVWEWIDARRKEVGDE